MTVVAFDFDGTLSDSEMTVLLGKRCGTVERDSTSGRAERVNVADEMAEITERSMNDEIDYAESLRKRAALLEGLDEADVAAAYSEVELREGAASLIQALNDAGVTTAILTGGFERGVEAALEREQVAVDHVVANRLPMADGKLTGEVEGTLIEGTKDTALEDLATLVGADMEETIAVGDGANDLPMLRVAGLSIGFDPKPAVEPHCEVVVTSMAGVRDTLLAEGVLDRT